MFICNWYEHLDNLVRFSGGQVNPPFRTAGTSSDRPKKVVCFEGKKAKRAKKTLFFHENFQFGVQEFGIQEDFVLGPSEIWAVLVLKEGCQWWLQVTFRVTMMLSCNQIFGRRWG